MAEKLPSLEEHSANEWQKIKQRAASASLPPRPPVEKRSAPINDEPAWKRVNTQAASASLPTRPTKPALPPRKQLSYEPPLNYPQAGPALRFTSEGFSAVTDTPAPSKPTTTDVGLHVKSDHQSEASSHDGSATTKVKN
jgi:hypothetical protein